MEKMLADIKKGLIDVDKKHVAKLLASKNQSDRELGAILQKKLDDDTGMMKEYGAGYGRRIGASGKAEGPMLKKNEQTGLYISEKEMEDEKKREARGTKKMAVGGMATKMTPKQQAKVGKVMKEFKEGSLHSGAGKKAPVVKSQKQAVAIALSEARRKKK